MKLSLIVEHRYLRQNITTALVTTLREHHVSIDVLCPQDCHFLPETGVVRTEAGTEYDLLGYDAVISRCRNVLGLAMLGYADTAGIPMVKYFRAGQHARNKAEGELAL